MALPFLRHSGTLPRLCGLLVILATGALFALVACPCSGAPRAA